MQLECIGGLIEVSVLGVMVAQQPPNLLGVGSSPTGRVSKESWRNWLAHRTVTAGVAGSSPVDSVYKELGMLVKKNDVEFQVTDNLLYESFWNWNDWEIDTYKNINKFFNQDKIFIDIGAWIGPIVLYAAKYNKMCYAVEPDPIAYRELQANILLNKFNNVYTHNVAISDKIGYTTMGSDTLGNSMTKLGHQHNQFITKTTTISNFLLENNINKNDIGIIKIDVEGAEVNILSDEVFNDTEIPVHLSVHTPFFKHDSDISLISSFVSKYDNKIETYYPHGFFDVLVYN